LLEFRKPAIQLREAGMVQSV